MSNHTFHENLSIDGLSLPVRTVHALNRAQITTLDQLQTLSIQELTQIRGIGKTGIQTVLALCEQYSIHLPLKPNPPFSQSSLLRFLSRKTIILFRKVNISTLEDIPMHSTEELVQWCDGNLFRASEIYKELELAGIPTHASKSPFIFEIRSLSPICISSLLWHGIDRIDQLMNMSEKELYEVRNLGKKRVEELLQFQKEHHDLLSVL